MPRALGAFETAAVLTGDAHALNVVFVLRLAGEVAPVRLQEALAELQRRHPLLARRLVTARGRHRFVAGAPPAPLRTVERGGAAGWRAVAEAELGRGIDLREEAPLRCVYVPPAAAGGGCAIVLTAHHAVLDGASSAPLLAELVALCGPSPALAAPAGEVPPPAEALFPRRHRGLRAWPGRGAYLLRQGLDELRYRLGRRGRGRPPAAPPADCRVLPLTLHAAATARLVQRSRRERATLNGAVTAALLLAAQRHLHGGRPGVLRCFTWTDLRPYLQPSPPATAVAAYVAPLRLTLQLGADPAFWPLARRVSRQIGSAGHRGDKFHAVRLIPAAMRRLLRQETERMADVAVSYTGAVRFAAGSGPSRVVGLHAFVSNLPRGPELTASVKLFGDRLVWDIVYLDTDMSADRARTVAGEIVRTLIRETREGALP